MLLIRFEYICKIDRNQRLQFVDRYTGENPILIWTAFRRKLKIEKLIDKYEVIHLCTAVSYQ